MFEALGLSKAAETIYREMLLHPQETLPQLAARTQLTLDSVRDGLDELHEVALVSTSSQVDEYRALNPIDGVKKLLARQQDEMLVFQRRLEASLAAATRLIAQCSELGGASPGSEGDELLGIEAIRGRLEELSEAAVRTIMTFAPGGAHTEADLLASRGPNARLLERGVRSQTIYLDSIRNDQATCDHVQWLNDHGAMARTTAALPTRMIIFDRRVAVLPTDTQDAAVGAVVLRGRGNVAALCALFDELWAGATPWGDRPQRKETGLTGQEVQVIRLLAEGITDEAIAKRLGVSTRTVRRLVANVMTVLDARSRFEAGVRAVQGGWIDPGR
ncbi:DUF6879 family protein [Streptomyces sp. NPDC002513]